LQKISEINRVGEEISLSKLVPSNERTVFVSCYFHYPLKTVFENLGLVARIAGLLLTSKAWTPLVWYQPFARAAVFKNRWLNHTASGSRTLPLGRRL
jgi:hypothetical protein